MNMAAGQQGADHDCDRADVSKALTSCYPFATFAALRGPTAVCSGLVRAAEAAQGAKTLTESRRSRPRPRTAMRSSDCREKAGLDPASACTYLRVSAITVSERCDEAIGSRAVAGLVKVLVVTGALQGTIKASGVRSFQNRIFDRQRQTTVQLGDTGRRVLAMPGLERLIGRSRTSAKRPWGVIQSTPPSAQDGFPGSEELHRRHGRTAHFDRERHQAGFRMGYFIAAEGCRVHGRRSGCAPGAASPQRRNADHRDPTSRSGWHVDDDRDRCSRVYPL